MKSAFADLEATFPAEWDRLPFWASYRRIKRPATGTEELLSVYRDYGVIRKSDREDNFNKASDDLTTYQAVLPGDLVINKMKAWQGSVAVSQLGGIVSPAYFVFSPVLANVSQFMHYLLRSAPYIEAYIASSKGIRPNQWDLDPDILRTFPLPRPSFELQRQIAEFLDRETAEIDAFIADQEELIGLLAERRAATISHAVTKGLDPSVPMKDVGTEWLGEVPADWQHGQVRRLRPHCESGTSVNGYPFPIADGDIGVLKTGSVSKGYFDPRENKQVTDDDLGKVTVPVRRGALLVNRANSPDIVGAGALVRAAAPGLYLSDKLWQLDFDFGSTDFIYYWTQSSYYRSQIRSLSVGASSSMQNLSYGDFLSLAVTYPEMTEQHRIAEYLDRGTVKLDAGITDARTAITLSRERRAALISAAVTGKIDVRDVSGKREINGDSA